MQWNFPSDQRVHFQSVAFQQERSKEQNHHVNNYIFNRKHASQSYVMNELDTYKGGVNSYLENHNHQKIQTIINRSVGTLNQQIPAPANHIQQQQLSEIQKNIFRKIYKESKGQGSKILEERRIYENQRVSQTQNLEKLQQRLNQIMDWKKNPEESLLNSGTKIQFSKSLARNAPKSQTFKKQAEYNVKNYLNYDNKNWRSITPEAVENQDRRQLQEKVITEPNDQKKMTKSVSQESNLIKQNKFQDKSAINLRGGHQFLIQEEDEYDTSNKKHSNNNNQPDSVQKFQKPLNESSKQKSSISKLNEISHQINTIIIQCKQNNVKYKKDQMHRPQSELISMYDIGKSSLMRIRQQGSNQLSSVNSTNLHLRRKQDDYEQFNDQIRGGTETERSYLNQKFARESLFDNEKKITQLLLLRRSPNSNQRKTNSMKKSSGMSNQFYRSMNDEFIQRDDDHQVESRQFYQQDEGNKSIKKLIDKKSAFSSESQKSGNKKQHDQNQLYLEYIRLIQKKPLIQQEKSPKDNDLRQNMQRNASGIELPCWSSEKSDNQSKNKLSFRVSSYYTQNQQSQSQSSFRQKEEDKQLEKENSKSENTTSRNHNNKIIVSNYINETTPTKTFTAFKDSMRQFHSPKILPQQLPSYQVSNSKINSLLSSMNKFQQIISSEKESNIDQFQYNKSQKIQFDEFNLQLFKFNSKPQNMQADPNQTHIIISCQDFSVRMLNLYSGRINILGKHQRPISALSNIIIEKQNKVFYSGSRDGVIKQWTSDSMHGNYKLSHQIRLKEPPLQIILSSSKVFILTANSVYCNEKITLNGSVQCMLQTPAHELLIAIDDTIFRLNKNQIEPQIQLMGCIKQMIQDENNIYVLTNRNFLCVLEDKNKIQFLNEITIKNKLKIIQIHHKKQILALTEENKLIIIKCEAPYEIKELVTFDCQITSFLTQNQIILVGKNNKEIETLKCN